MHKLLIVDDEEYVRNGLKKRFSWQEFGFKVIGTCNNGQEALDFVRTNQTHVVLTDIKMPGMGGLELATQIHQLFPEIHIILLSAYNDFKFAQEAIKLGVKGYLLKPAEEDEVRELFTSISKSLRLADLPNHIPPAPADLSSYNSIEKHCITLAKQFVEEHIESKITLQEVARELHFTAAYFSIFFKKETSQNFIDYVTEVKIKKAMQLLQYSDFLVKDIAYKVGYDDYSYFCKIFRKYVGTTPLDYRTNRMK